MLAMCFDIQMHVTVKVAARLREFVEKCAMRHEEHIYGWRAFAIITTWWTHMAKSFAAHERGIASQTFANMRCNTDAQHAG